MRRIHLSDFMLILGDLFVTKVSRNPQGDLSKRVRIRDMKCGGKRQREAALVAP